MGCDASTAVEAPPGTSSFSKANNLASNSPDSRLKDPFKIHGTKVTPAENMKNNELIEEVNDKMPHIFEETKISEGEDDKEKMK